jgi:hypothetical protein
MNEMKPRGILCLKCPCLQSQIPPTTHIEQIFEQKYRETLAVTDNIILKALGVYEGLLRTVQCPTIVRRMPQ